MIFVTSQPVKRIMFTALGSILIAASSSFLPRNGASNIFYARAEAATPSTRMNIRLDGPLPQGVFCEPLTRSDFVELESPAASDISLPSTNQMSARLDENELPVSVTVEGITYPVDNSGVRLPKAQLPVGIDQNENSLAGQMSVARGEDGKPISLTLEGRTYPIDGTAGSAGPQWMRRVLK